MELFTFFQRTMRGPGVKVCIYLAANTSGKVPPIEISPLAPANRDVKRNTALGRQIAILFTHPIR